MATSELEEGVALTLDWSKLEQVAAVGGVVPCAVQDADTDEVILVAYVNQQALQAAIETRSAVFWSTSRNELWEKGKTSGETFDLLEVRVNCEQNSLLYRVRPRRGGICHTKNAAEVDKPIAGLLKDLKGRGLLDDTLVLWGGEFGRTPVAQGGRDGRDHNPEGFTMWMAGGGVKPGFAYGATDDYGYYAAQDKVHIHDLHATLLALLGLNHEQLTYRYGGRNFRLTDVHGAVVQGIMA